MTTKHPPNCVCAACGTGFLPTLFGHPRTLPYQPHSPESKEAAKLAETDAGTARARVLKIIRAFGVTGITDEGIQKALRMDPSTERPRRVELVKAGLVEKHPNLTGTTSRGRRAAMWRAV